MTAPTFKTEQAVIRALLEVLAEQATMPPNRGVLTCDELRSMTDDYSCEDKGLPRHQQCYPCRVFGHLRAASEALSQVAADAETRGVVLPSPASDGLLKIKIMVTHGYVELENFDGSDRQRRIVDASVSKGWRVDWQTRQAAFTSNPETCIYRYAVVAAVLPCPDCGVAHHPEKRGGLGCQKAAKS